MRAYLRCTGMLCGDEVSSARDRVRMQSAGDDPGGDKGVAGPERQPKRPAPSANERFKAASG